MALRISGTLIPQDRRVEVALTYIYGIGRTASTKILAATQIGPDTRAKDLTEDEEQRIRDYIKANYRIEGDLKREVLGNIKRLKDIKSYRGVRHAKRLPVRGQRTKTNSRTVRGNVRITAVSGKKKSAEKT